MTLTASERRQLSSRVGHAVLHAQEHFSRSGREAEEVIPELIAVLLSLAATIARDNASLSKGAFLEGCSAAADQVYLT